MRLQKNNFQYLYLLAPILFFFFIIFTAEKSGYKLEGSDINFDLLIFLSNGIFKDPFELELFTPNRGFTSIVGNIYQMIFEKPNNYSQLLMAYRIGNILPLLFFIFYLIKKNNIEVNNFFLIILLVLSIDFFHQKFLNFIMKYTAVIFFLFYCFLLSHYNLKTIKVKLGIMSFLSVFLYPLTLPVILMMTAVFKIKKFNEWLSLFLICLPSILVGLIILIYHHNGADTYNSYDPMYGSHNPYLILWYLKRLVSQFLTLEILLGLSVLILSLSYLAFQKEYYFNQFNRYKRLLFKVIFYTFCLFLFLTILRNFDVKLPFYQYLEYVVIPFGFIWLTLFLSIKISFFLKKRKIKFTFDFNIIFLILVFFYLSNYFQLYNKFQYNILEREYVSSLEKRIINNKLYFENINCEVKLLKFESVHLRLLTKINNLRPFDVTFQNPYSKLALPKYIKYVEGYSPKEYNFEVDIPVNNILKCQKKSQ